MNWILLILAGLTVAAALAAVCWRNLIRAVLCLAVSFTGVAMIYLRLGAEFVGFAQVLVYVGAVAVLIVFALLLTRRDGVEPRNHLSAGWASGLVIAGGVFVCLAHAIANSNALSRQATGEVTAPVKQIGVELMTTHVLPLELIALLLTVATLGAVILALPERTGKKPEEPHE